MSNYADQIRAFFHYTFKIVFNIEFGLRILFEILILLIIIHFILKIITAVTRVIMNKLLVIADFFVYDVFYPIGIKTADYFEYKLGSPKWKSRSNKIKQKVLDHDAAQEDEQTKKRLIFPIKIVGLYILVYIILVSYIELFHYCLPHTRANYPIFFVLEDIIIEGEYFIENIVFETDEEAIPSFYELT